jgi:hypothetical protein
LGLEAVEVIDHLEGETLPFDGGGARRRDTLEQRQGLGHDDFLADPARHQVSDQSMEPTGGLVPRPRPLGVAAGQQPPHGGVVLDPDRHQHRARRASMATERASLESFLSQRPEPSSRTRDANVAGMSTTVSPAARSCWANR